MLGWVVMAACVRKVGSRATASVVDVKSEETRIVGGKSLNGDLHQNAVPSLIKSHLPAQKREGIRAADFCNRVGQGKLLFHTITSM